MMTVSTGQGFTRQVRRSEYVAAWDGRRAGVDRMLGAVDASDSFAFVLTEAMRAMIEARFILAGTSVPSLLSRRDEAVLVLEQGIAEARYALNLSDEEPA